MMICEDCGASMQWRCTDNNTNISKFKCPHCGHIQTNKEKLILAKKIPKFNYCYFMNGRWIVKKTVNRKELYVGCFPNKEMAKQVVEGMKACNWDKNMIPSVIEEAKLCTSA